MMPKYGKRSKVNLESATPALQDVFNEVIRRFDNSVLEGKRSRTRQAELVASGASKTMESRHLKGEAVDSAPYPIRWPKLDESTKQSLINDGLLSEVKAYAKSLGRWYYYGGYVLGTADAMGIPLRWGGDWDNDREVNDQNFDDLPHFEED
jgi:peptidoglycan L-alanyl-D-glutamate endopeptidase CwlK